jgi:hypothetical protein
MLCASVPISRRVWLPPLTSCVNGAFAGLIPALIFLFALLCKYIETLRIVGAKPAPNRAA